jgi:hypothetical protein
MMNLGYIHSQVPLHAYVLCTEQANMALSEVRGKNSGSEARAMLRAFAQHKGSNNAAAVRDTADAAVLLVMDFDKDTTCGIGYLDSIATGIELLCTKGYHMRHWIHR